MPGIRLEFAQFGHFDSFDIIRSTTSMVGIADVDLPTPIATGVKTMYYVDTNVIENNTYYYKVRVWRGVDSLVSSEVSVFTQPIDPHWDNVVALLRFNGDVVNLKGTPWISPGWAFEEGKFGLGFSTNAYDWRQARANVIDASQDFGSEDFTIDLWFTHKGVNNLWGGVFCKRVDYSNQSFALFMPPGTTSLGFECAADSSFAYLSFGSFIVGQPEFISIERQGNVLRALRSGEVVMEALLTGSIKVVNAPFEVGRIDYNRNDNWSNCIIDELRVTKGVSRYKGSHVVPTHPFWSP